MRHHTIVLEGRFAETTPSAASLARAMGHPKRFRFDQLIVRVETLLRRPGVTDVVVECRPGFRCDWYAGIDAVRAQIDRLRAAGKRVHFYAKEYGMIELILGAAADRRLIHPHGRLAWLGVAEQFTFVKRLLDRHKVGVEVIRAGRYKAAGDPFRVDELDSANREQRDAILDVVIESFTERIIPAYGKTSADLDALLAGRILGAPEAVTQGWVHAIQTPFDLVDQWKGRKLRLRSSHSRFGRGPRIVVLEFEGGIRDGESGSDPLLGTMIGSDSYLPVIRKLKKDRCVKGVVFRINSGGGSATASEDIAHELGKLRAIKPVVVSMSEVAGSGGYWIATESDHIFAERTTVTGSIGVIGMLFCFRELFERYGLSHSVIRRGQYADLGSLWRPVSDDDRQLVQAEIDRLYRSFVQRVATARGLTVEQVEELAGGRIYSGQQAQAIGLVDEIGGLTDAIAHIKQRLGLKRAQVCFLPQPKLGMIQRILLQKTDPSGEGSGPLMALRSQIVTRRGHAMAIMEPVIGRAAGEIVLPSAWCP